MAKFEEFVLVRSSASAEDRMLVNVAAIRHVTPSTTTGTCMLAMVDGHGIHVAIPYETVRDLLMAG